MATELAMLAFELGNQLLLLSCSNLFVDGLAKFFSLNCMEPISLCWLQQAGHIKQKLQSLLIFK